MTEPTNPASAALILALENKRYEAMLSQDFDALKSLCHAELRTWLANIMPAPK